MTGYRKERAPLRSMVGRRAVLRGGLVGGAAAALTAACGRAKQEQQEAGPSGRSFIGATPTVTAAQPKYGGSLVTAIPKELTNYDPHQAVDSSKVAFLNLTSNGLFRLKTKDVTDFQSLAIEPDVLAAMPEMPDKTTLILKLRPGIKWHNLPPVNGRVLDAEDVKYNIERMKQPRLPAGANERAWIQAAVDAVQVTDPLTVVVKFKQPFPLWPTFMATPYQKLTPREVSAPETTVIGTGPFVMVRHDRDAQGVFRKNPEYFKQGLPYLDEVIVRIDPTPAHRLAGLKTGDYAFNAVNPEEFRELKQANPKVVEHKYLGLTFPCWGFDTTVPSLQDVRVRRAIFMAIDWPGILKALYEGDGYQLPPIPAGFTEYVAKLSDLPYHQYNVAKAKAMMQEAGYSATNQLRVEIETNQGYPENIKMQPILQEQLKEIFVNVTALPTVPPTEFLGKRNAPGQGWTIRMWSHDAFTDPDEFLFSFYHSTGSRNYGKWGSPQLDALIEKQRGDVTKEERKAILLTIQKELDDKAYRQGVVVAQPRYAVQPWVRGFVTLAASVGYQTLQLENTWIDRG